jgi:hypothetical protein
MQVNEQKQSELTNKMLRKRLSYSRSNGVFTWKDGQHAGAVAGHVISNGYRQIKLYGRSYYAHRLAWLWCHKEWPAADIDHKNGLRDDNRILNLREATRSENLRNQRLSPRNTSGKMGVYWSNSAKRWVAEMNLRSGRLRLGRFKSYDEAANARAQAERKHGFDVTHGKRG